ncbi:hypothetical protein BJ742DRAFT_787276 [Cladochytrium replicatum]|nr:hypothetical protein BJ742DRAFT_787276 [Cladochytrium replicatum]
MVSSKTLSVDPTPPANARQSTSVRPGRKSVAGDAPPNPNLLAPAPPTPRITRLNTPQNLSERTSVNAPPPPRLSTLNYPAPLTLLTDKKRDSAWGRPEFNLPPGPLASKSLVHKTLFETQQIAPSPSLTYFQLVVQEDRVLLRDWPRQRLSQKWTRSGTMNPGTTELSFEEFLRGELKDRLLWIFGEPLYNKCIELVFSHAEQREEIAAAKAKHDAEEIKSREEQAAIAAETAKSQQQKQRSLELKSHSRTATNFPPENQGSATATPLTPVAPVAKKDKDQPKQRQGRNRPKSNFMGMVTSLDPLSSSSGEKQ